MWYQIKKLWDKTLFKIVWSWINIFEWEKKYYSTSSIQLNKVLEPESIITYENRQSRANMEFEKWTVIFAKMKDTNKVIIIDENLSNNGIFSTWFTWIKWNEKYIFHWYLLYYFSSNYFNKIKDDLSSWVTQVAINNSWVAKIPIPLPPLPTQKLIVQKLDSSFEKIDKSIELTKKNLENIEELNKSVLDEVFREWKIFTFDEICNKVTDWSHNPPKWVDNWIPMISSRNLDDNNNVTFDNIRYIDEENYIRENKRTNVEEWDILLSIVWTIWKVAIVKSEYWKFVMQRSLAVLKLKSNIVDSFYIYYFLKSDISQKILINWANWAAQQWIYLKEIKKLTIPLPPLEKQKEIVAQLDQVFEKNKALKESYEKKLKDLEEMKQSLLKEAFEWRLVKE